MGASFCSEIAASRPDAGGTGTLMAELNVAYEEARRELSL
jgi:hypothetical protein